MRNVYALLVGINAYPNPLKALSGCVNDALAMQEYLEERIEPRDRLSLSTLLDGEATRDAIIQTFRSHLGKARTGDTALFFYAGHGSQEEVPELYRHLEPDGRCESLLAVDSRREGCYAIADKELRVLIAEIARHGAHVVVILDSCHSGSATRVGEEEVARWADPDLRQRSADTYWFLAPEAGLTEEERKCLEELGGADGWRILPSGQHVLLAACMDHQRALELIFPDGSRRGAFSYHLIESLENLGGGVRYRDLFKRVQVLVNNQVPHQLPQAEGDLEAALFNGAVPPRPPVYHVRKHQDGRWKLDAGAVHGLRKGSELAVFSAGTEIPKDLTRRIATVALTEIDVAESVVKVCEGKLPRDEVALPAVLARLPHPLLRIAFEGMAAPEALRREIARSALLEVIDDPRTADVVILQKKDGYHLQRPGAGIDLVPPFSESGLAQALEHVARWEGIARIDNPGSLLTGSITMTVYEWQGPPDEPGGEPVFVPLPEDDEPRLIYREKLEGDFEPRRFTVKVENQGNLDLYFALFALDGNFGVKLVGDANGRLAAERTIWVRAQDGIDSSVPERYYRQGVTQRRDVLLLLASEKPVDFHLLEQDGLGTSYIPPSPASMRSDLLQGVLGNLMLRVGYREVNQEVTVVHQWAAQKQIIIAERPAVPIDLRGTHGEIELHGGIRLGAPEGLHARARLANAATAARTLGERLIPPPQASGVETRPVALAGALASDGGLTVMELAGEDLAAVTPRSPLWIESGAEIPADEVPVALVFDGAAWSMNVSEEKKGQGVRYTIPALPAPRGSGELAGKVWILFRSVRREDLPRA